MELYLYSPIFNFTADEEILPKLHEASQAENPEEEEVVMRVNSPGGSVASGWGIAAKMSEIPNKITAKVDGLAASMAAVVLMFADNVEALDVSQLMIHRAAGPDETEEERNLLERVNRNLKDKLKNKVDEAKFKQIAGISIDDLFNQKKERYNVWLTAKQAKQIGIVDRIRNVEDKETKAEYHGSNIAALNNIEGVTIEGRDPKKPSTPDPSIPEPNANQEPENKETMTFEEFKAQYPSLFNQAKEEGKQEGINQERERVKSLLTYVDADQKDVCERIKNGEELQPSVREDYVRKLQSGAVKSKMEKDSPEGTQTPQGGEGEPEDEEQKEAQAFWDAAVKPELSSNE